MISLSHAVDTFRAICHVRESTVPEVVVAIFHRDCNGALSAVFPTIKARNFHYLRQRRVILGLSE